MKCKHDWLMFYADSGSRVGMATTNALGYRCILCREYKSLGPANDEDERVRVEIRAAEIARLAAEYEFTKSMPGAIAMTNIGGPKSEAAVLARVIYEHHDQETP